MNNDMQGACKRQAISRRKFVRYLAATAPLPIIVPRTALAAPGRPGANALLNPPRRTGYELPNPSEKT